MMNDRLKRSPEQQGTGGFSGEIDTEGVLDNPEPWEEWETKLVLYSIGIGIVSLVVFGILINIFILNK